MAKKFIVGLVLLFFCITVFPAVTINIVVVNPSGDEEKTIPVKQYLPAEITKEDIIDSNGLDIDYDVHEAKYFLYGKPKLAPKESMKYRVVLKDVWNIMTDQIEQLSAIVDKKVANASAEDKSAAQVVADGIKLRLSKILSVQEINKDDIEKKMQAYATNYNELKKIRDEIFSFENLVKYSITEGEQDTVTLVVEAENILDKPMEADVKYYLPEEITSEYILDSGGLEVNYDPDRAQFFLSKDEKFKAQEKKRYNVSIKKIWAIGEKDLEMYLTEAEELNQKIKGSDSEMIGQALYDEIVANVEKIKKSQNQAKTVKEYIAAYRKNLRDEEQIKDDLEKLKILAVESQSDAVNRQVNQAFQKMDNITTIKMKDIAQKLIQKIKKIGVWRIIFVMVIFLISLTTFFYTIWFLRLRKEEKTEIKDIGKQE